MIMAMTHLRVALLAVLLAAAGPAICQPLTKEQGGIVVSVPAAAQDAIVVNWRFSRALENPVEEITADVHGRTVGEPTVVAYPGPDDKTAGIILLDVSGRSRAVQIERQKRDMLLLLASQRSHQSFALGIYAGEAGLLVPTTNDASELLDMVAGLSPLDQSPDLLGALVLASGTLKSRDATRRVLYILTDGHSTQPDPSPEAVARIREFGVAVVFLILPSDRTANVAGLRALAEATGGQLVEPDDFNKFFQAPFETVDSGGTVTFPLGDSFRLLWEDDQARVAILYGRERLEIAVPTTLRMATLAEHWEAAPARLGAGGAGAVMALLGAWVLLKRKRTSAKRTSVSEEERLKVLATLQDIKTGTIYPVLAAVAHLGREETNDIVLADATVSRQHAVFEQGGFGDFSVKAKSPGVRVRVNGHDVQKSALADGDIVEIGMTALKYSRSRAATVSTHIGPSS